jgi:hypothetical protein
MQPISLAVAAAFTLCVAVPAQASFIGNTLNTSLAAVFGSGAGSTFSIAQDDQTLSNFVMSANLVAALRSDATVQFTQAFLNPPSNSIDFYAMTITAGAASFLTPGVYSFSYLVTDPSAAKGDSLASASSSYNATPVSPDLSLLMVSGPTHYVLDNLTGGSTSINFARGTTTLQITDTLTVGQRINSDLSSITNSLTHQAPAPGMLAAFGATLAMLAMLRRHKIWRVETTIATAPAAPR